MPDAFDVKRAMDAAEAAAKDGDFVAAERYLREVLRLQTASVGPKHPDVASTLHNLAVVAERAGRIADAEELYRRAYQLASAALPPTHALVARCREDLDGFLEARVVPLRGPGMEQAVSAARAADPPAAAAPTSSSRSALVVVVALIALAAGAALYLLLGSAGTGPAANVAARSVQAPAEAPPSDPTPAPGVAGNEPPAAAPETPATEPQTSPEPTAPAPEAAAPEPAPASEPPVPAASAETSPPSSAGADPTAESSDVSVVLARLCRDLITTGAWTCVAPEAPVTPGRLVFYTRIASPRPTQLVHRWWHGDRLVRARTLNIGASSREGYRTYSRLTVEAAQRGDWRVELVGADGRVLAEERFAVQ